MVVNPRYVIAMPEPMFYDDWRQIKSWLDEHNITWHAMGNKTIGFDDPEHLMLFILKWA
jgi:hypothetical protein